MLNYLKDFSLLESIEMFWDKCQRHLLTIAAATFPIIYFGDGAYGFLTEGNYDQPWLAAGSYLCGFAIESGAPRAFVSWYRGKRGARWLVALWGLVAGTSVFALHSYTTWHGYGLGFVVYAAPFIAYSARAIELSESEDKAEKLRDEIQAAEQEARIELLSIQGKAEADKIRTEARNLRKVSDAEAASAVNYLSISYNKLPEVTEKLPVTYNLPPSNTGNLPELSEKLPKVTGNLPDNLPRDLRKIRKSEEMMETVRTSSIKELMTMTGATDKTVRNWKKSLG